MRRTIEVEKIDHHLDLRAKMCPFLILELRLALKEMGAGEVLEVVSDFYPARQTIPQHVREFGYSYELVDGDKPIFRFLIRKG
jgi:TusA-related sulfurtransferase